MCLFPHSEFCRLLASLDLEVQGSSLGDRWIVVAQGVTMIVP